MGTDLNVLPRPGYGCHADRVSLVSGREFICQEMLQVDECVTIIMSEDPSEC